VVILSINYNYYGRQEKTNQKTGRCRENLVKATQDQRKETDRLNRYIKDLTDKQSGIIKKNLDGVIPDNVLKQQLAMIDKELLEANAALAGMPNTETNYEEAMLFLEEYLKKPSIVWRNAKVAVQIKLQWFQFPQGLTFQNNLFGTNEMSMFFKAKEVISDDKSATVDPRRFELLTFALQKRCSTN
jgi:site-specific DNA recombinase